MPGKNGIELAEEIVLRKPEIKVVLTSGYSDDKIQYSKIGEKGFKFLSKPYSSDGVLRVMNEAIESNK